MRRNRIITMDISSIKSNNSFGKGPSFHLQIIFLVWMKLLGPLQLWMPQQAPIIIMATQVTVINREPLPVEERVVSLL
jgi:hypothetical protein